MPPPIPNERASGRAGAIALGASTIFVSAFLLFLVQPLIARQILPWFGGSAAVWTLCLVFFQVVLLLGYLYADRMSRLPLRAQAVAHTLLLLGACALLPIIPDAAWRPAGDADPVRGVLGVLAVTIGLPYLAVCTTGPLVQSWVARLNAGDARRQARVYRLFALSNLAALAALVLYPFVLEPAFALHAQAFGWSAGFGLFALLAIASAWASERYLARQGLAEAGIEAAHADAQAPPGWRLHALWLLLSALGTLALLSFSAHITQDIASVPLLWILPLALYLLTFVLCFDSGVWYRRLVFWPAVLAVTPLLAWYLVTKHTEVPITSAIALFCGGLFVVCMFCHGELAKARPAPAHLTRYYLMMALGGALGGLFAGVAAPRIFNGNWELPLGLAMPGLLVSWLAWAARGWLRRAGALGLAASVAVAWLTIADIRETDENTLSSARNFYGTLRVEQFGSDRSPNASRRLMNGVISHGEQAVPADKRREPVSYYGRESGAGVVMAPRGLAPRRVGIIGLGVGTVAAYGRAGDTLRFYEINPLVITAAHDYFTYLSDSAATIEIAQGDARLLMQQELEAGAAQDFDVIVVDAFSGDAIPVHLMTREALAIYRRHLKPQGVIAFHVSNRHLELAPVVKRLADDAGMQARLITDEPPLGSYIEHSSDYVLVTASEAWLAEPRVRARGQAIDGGAARLWTDDYSNLLAALGRDR